MAIHKVGNNKYKIIIELGKDISGQRRRKKETFIGTREEALKRHGELYQRYYHIGKKLDSKDLLFEEYAELYVKKYCIPNISAITLQSYEKLLITINKYIGKKKLKDITPFALDDLYSKLKYGKQGQLLSYYSQYDYYKLLRAMFRKAVSWDLIEKDPHNKISNKPKKVKKERVCYDLNQVSKLIKALDKECITYKAMILLVLDSSIRRSEVLALRWQDINFEKRTININKSLKVIKGGLVDEKTTKSEYSKRIIVISESTINVLKEYKEWQEEQIRILGKQYKNENRVFASKFGNNLNPSTCGNILRKIIRRHNLDPLPFHSLRHTSASLLIHEGLDVKSVSERLGHSDASITLKVYTHAFEKSRNECATAMNEILKKCAKMPEN